MTAPSSTMLAYLPSPPQGVWDIGPFPLRAYALCIIAGIIVAVWWGNRRWIARGGQDGEVLDVAIWAVPFGLLGGRLYHLITDWKTYFGSDALKEPIDALKIWDGGLGIWGAVALGAVGAWIGARRRGIRLPAFGDAIAPPILLAQAIGRLGNYFNQELYGRETTLPWGLEIYERENAAGYSDPGLIDGVSNGVVVAVVHPTFLYELLWNVLIVVLLVAVDRLFRIGHGRLFALYVAGYCLGRFFVELLRDDRAAVANDIAGIRPNLFTAALVFLGAIIYFVVATKGREQGLEMYHDDRAAELEEQGVAGYVDDWYDEDLEPEKPASTATAPAAAGAVATAAAGSGGSSLFDDDDTGDDDQTPDHLMTTGSEAVEDEPADGVADTTDSTGSAEVAATVPTDAGTADTGGADAGTADTGGADAGAADTEAADGETKVSENTEVSENKDSEAEDTETADVAVTAPEARPESDTGDGSVGTDAESLPEPETEAATEAELAAADPEAATAAEPGSTEPQATEPQAAEPEAAEPEAREPAEAATDGGVNTDVDADAEVEAAGSAAGIEADPDADESAEAAPATAAPVDTASTDTESTDTETTENTDTENTDTDTTESTGTEPADPTPGEDGPAADQGKR